MQNRSDIQCQYHYKQIKGKIAYHSLDQNSISNPNTGFQNYFECDSQKVDLKEKKNDNQVNEKMRSISQQR